MVFKLYITRWEVETSFKDFVMSMKIEDFHAKDINGVLQEIYARLWLMNFTRILILKSGRVHLNPEERVCKKPNYKILYSWVSDNLKKIFDGLTHLWDEFVETISITMEKRKRRSRRYTGRKESIVSPLGRLSDLVKISLSSPLDVTPLRFAQKLPKENELLYPTFFWNPTKVTKSILVTANEIFKSL